MSQVQLPLRGLDAVPASSQAGSGAAARARRAPGPHSQPGRLGPAFAVVYIALSATLLVDPQPVLDRLDDLDPSPAVSAARSAVGAVAAVSGALGLSTLSAAVRGRMAPLFKRPEARQ